MIGDKLKDARLSKKLKQADVAALLGIAPTSFSNWESGRTNPPLETLEKVCTIYEISPIDLLDKAPTMGDIVSILKKRVSDRTYEENIALSFSGDIAGWVGEETKVNPQETELLTIFRGLKKNEKDLVMRMMAGLSFSKK